MRTFDNTQDGRLRRWTRPLLAITLLFLVAILTVPLLHCQALSPVRHDNHPLAPWQKVGSDPFVLIVNQSQDTMALFAQAPSIDRTIRFLGFVSPNDSTTFRLPYADGEVLMRIAVLEHSFRVLSIYEPGTRRFVIIKNPNAP